MTGMTDVALVFGLGFQSGVLAVWSWRRRRYRPWPPTGRPRPTEPEPHGPLLSAHCHCGELR